MWGGSEEKRNTHWVSWNDVCMPMENGGLGLKRLEFFNKSLFFKWRWKILETSNSLWFRILKARYMISSYVLVTPVKNIGYSGGSSV